MSDHMIKMAGYVLLTPDEELGSMWISDALFYGTTSTKYMTMHLHQGFKILGVMKKRLKLCWSSRSNSIGRLWNALDASPLVTRR